MSAWAQAWRRKRGPPKGRPTYYPEVFDTPDLADAMGIILTPEDGTTTAWRWERETPFLVDLIDKFIKNSGNTLVLDYGCGVGRLAKELIARHKCRVIGADISPNMRALSATYVASDLFISCSPAMLDVLAERGIIFDSAISVWVLQHCLDPIIDVTRIKRALKPLAPLFVVNNVHRAVPTMEMQWMNDGIDIRELLRTEFLMIEEGRLTPLEVSAQFSQHTFWASYLRR